MQNDTRSIIQHDNESSVAENINHEIQKLLFSQTFKIALMDTIASVVILFWLAPMANIEELTVFFSIVTLISLGRLLLHSAYKKYGAVHKRRLWLHAWALCSCLMGSAYGWAFVYFTPFAQAEYALSVGLFIIARCAGSAMMYSISMYGVLSFLIPIMLLPSYSLFTQGGSAGLLALVIMGLFTLALFMSRKTISGSFKKSILVGFQHQREQNKRKLIEQQLQTVSRRDGLTGLFNRRYFDEILEAEIGRAHRNHQSLCVLMLDIDYFEEYTLEYGHVGSDNCLLSVAEIVQALANRKGDLMARYGGAEFAIILPNIEKSGAIAFANKLQQEIQTKRIPHLGSKLTSLKCVTISIGVTNLMPFSKVSTTELIRNADIALYEAKRQGRNRVYFSGSGGLNHGASI